MVDRRFADRDSARASQLQVQNGAAVVINKCMNGPTEPKGGNAINFSKSHVSMDFEML